MGTSKDLYCGKCGSVKESVPDGFDTKTGKQRVRLICSQKGCPRYCETHGGHVYSWWNRTCKVCNQYAYEFTGY